VAGAGDRGGLPQALRTGVRYPGYILCLSSSCGGAGVNVMSQGRHLKRLACVWERSPCYFITVCTRQRRALLAHEVAHTVLRSEWAGLLDRHGWMVGRYVIMPDHAHFFVAPVHENQNALSVVIGRWKEWTAKRLAQGPIWQPEFFDHLLRSAESRSE